VAEVIQAGTLKLMPKIFTCEDGKVIDIEKCNYEVCFHLKNDEGN